MGKLEYQQVQVEMISRKMKKEKKKCKNCNINWSRKLKNNGKMRNETYQVIITPEEVQDPGGSQMAPKTQAGRLPADDNCPNNIGAVERIVPPQW
jgi:hypothetical protein